MKRGFLLPSLLGMVRDATGSYSPGLDGCAAAFLALTIVLLELGIRWSQRWDVSALNGQACTRIEQRCLGWTMIACGIDPAFARCASARQVTMPKMSYLVSDHTQTSSPTLLSAAGRVCIFKRTCTS
jgi:hypothetical protein